MGDKDKFEIVDTPDDDKKQQDTPPPPPETGFIGGLKRFGSQIAGAPSAVYHAFADDPRNPEEAAYVAEGNKNIIPPPQSLELGLKRLISDPMAAQKKTAQEYDAKVAQSGVKPEEFGDPGTTGHPIWDNTLGRFIDLGGSKSPEQQAANDAQHQANMHHIASMVPVLGPIAAPSVDRYESGDKSGAATDVLLNMATAAAIPKIIPRVGQLAKAAAMPVVRNIGSGLATDVGSGLAAHAVPSVAGGLIGRMTGVNPAEGVVGGAVIGKPLTDFLQPKIAALGTKMSQAGIPDVNPVPMAQRIGNVAGNFAPTGNGIFHGTPATPNVAGIAPPTVAPQSSFFPSIASYPFLQKLQPPQDQQQPKFEIVDDNQ